MENVFCRVERCKEKTKNGALFCDGCATKDLRPLSPEELRVALVKARSGVIRTMSMPGIRSPHCLVLDDSNPRQIDRLIGLSDPRATKADDLLTCRFVHYTWKEVE